MTSPTGSRHESRECAGHGGRRSLHRESHHRGTPSWGACRVGWATDGSSISRLASPADPRIRQTLGSRRHPGVKLRQHISRRRCARSGCVLRIGAASLWSDAGSRRPRSPRGLRVTGREITGEVQCDPGLERQSARRFLLRAGRCAAHRLPCVTAPCRLPRVERPRRPGNGRGSPLARVLEGARAREPQDRTLADPTRAAGTARLRRERARAVPWRRGGRSPPGVPLPSVMGTRLAETAPLSEQLGCLWPSDLLPGWYDEWVVDERELLRQLRLHALERAAEVFIRERRLDLALTLALEAVRAEPCGNRRTSSSCPSTWPKATSSRRYGYMTTSGPTYVARSGSSRPRGWSASYPGSRWASVPVTATSPSAESPTARLI